MTDLSRFHYYDMPQYFRAKISVRGTTSISVRANSREQAQAKIEAEIYADSFEPDLEDWDDVGIDYIRAEPTRMYLVYCEGSAHSATSRPGDRDNPREPTDEDTERCLRMGYVPSWVPAAS